MDRDLPKATQPGFFPPNPVFSLLSHPGDHRVDGVAGEGMGHGSNPHLRVPCGPEDSVGARAGMQETAGSGPRKRELDVDWIRSRWLSPQASWVTLGQSLSFSGSGCFLLCNLKA